jgi:hypothetical protein
MASGNGVFCRFREERELLEDCKLHGILLIEIGFQFYCAVAFGEDEVGLIELLHSAFYHFFQSEHPSTHSANHFLDVEGFSEGQISARAYFLDGSLSDDKAVDVGEAFGEVVFEICVCAHEGEELLVVQEVETGVFVPDEGEMRVYFAVELGDFVLDLGEVVVHDDVLADEDDGVVDVVALHQFAVEVHQVFEEVAFVVFVDHVVLQQSDVLLLEFSPGLQFGMGGVGESE